MSTLRIILVVFLAVAVVTASSICTIEDSVHPAETESHNQHEHDYNEKAKDNSSHSHQNGEGDICCETFLSYISATTHLDNSLPVSLTASLISQAEICTLPIISLDEPSLDIMHGFSSRQWERYALSNPPNGPPVI